MCRAERAGQRFSSGTTTTERSLRPVCRHTCFPAEPRGAITANRRFGGCPRAPRPPNPANHRRRSSAALSPPPPPPPRWSSLCPRSKPDLRRCSENGPLRFARRFHRPHVALATVAAVEGGKRGLVWEGKFCFCCVIPSFLCRLVSDTDINGETDSVPSFICGRERIPKMKTKRLQGKQTPRKT